MPATNPQQKQAYANLGIAPEDRIILALDGGGIRGILTLQLLKKIEEVAGLPCYKFCDMVAGTSTGAIIAGLIAAGKTAVEIEDLYIRLVTKVFLKRGVLANRFVNPPEYDKVNYRAALKQVLGDITLEQACKNTGIDILITSKDATGNEETFFTCFGNGSYKGTYKTALLRTVMEATMSAPTYFRPLERFLDGGTTTYNNPSLAALMEATRYDGEGKYTTDKITLFSLGTGKTVRSFSSAQLANPNGVDAYFWLNYVMDASSQDASSMQVDILRSGEFEGLDYRRFQMSLDTAAIGRIPNKDIRDLHIGNADWLNQLTNDDLNGIDLDDVKKFDLVRIIGQSMAEYIMQSNRFLRDLNNTPNKSDELITTFGDIPAILAQVRDPLWIDNKVPSG
jgi:predicted acylesterase/phospholipase RssA